MHKLSDFDFELPSKLIADYPLAQRDASRLLVVDNSGKIADKNFTDIIDFLQAGDCLVVNNSKVIPARLHAINKASKQFEVLLHKQLSDDTWQAFAKPTKKMQVGEVYNIAEDFYFTYEQKLESGEIVIKFNILGGKLQKKIEEVGKMPLPPYIKREQEEQDKNRYQTIYAKDTGSVAAPTAGLHFTGKLLERIKLKGVEIAEITLHVGAGTFQPVKEEDISNHKMHSESFAISKAAADKINSAKRVVAVGTTSTRVLESAADENGKVKEQVGETSIFINPPYKFKVTDCLITNFHLPKSTLFMLVSSMCGLEVMQKAYKHAIEKQYRFFSYGDACLLIK